MPRARVSDEALLAALLDVFREHGYEGTSLGLLEEATGLQRASLYHRFPGGKEEMAVALLEWIREQLEGEVLAPVYEEGPLRKRLARTAERLSAFYLEGRRSCLLEALSLGSPSPALRSALAANFEACLAAFTSAAKEGGASPARARRRAERLMTRIQGALILSRVLDRQEAFRRVMRGLPDQLLGEEGSSRGR